MLGAGAGNLRVAINAHLLSGEASYRRAGVHRYVDSLLRHLDRVDRRLSVTAMVGKKARVPDGAYEVMRSSWPTHMAPIRVMWEQGLQPSILRELGADVVHGPVNVGPVLSECPLVITVHDLSFIRHPRMLRFGSRIYLTALTRLSARRATRIIAVSEHTAAEASQLLGVAPGRIDIVYHGIAEMFRPLPTEQVEGFRRREGLPERFVLFLGTLEPRKNLLRLITAFSRCRAENWGIVLAGGVGWGNQELIGHIQVLGLADRAVLPGYVADEDLPLLYNSAEVFAYPSLYEGFGMPVLEAMACGTAVLTSNTSSLPEVAGDAAMLVDPQRVETIAAGLDRLMGDPEMRQDMRVRGIARAMEFNWCRAARETAQVYARVAERST